VKKQLSTVLFALISLLGLGVGARAQNQEIVIAKVSYDFVVHGAVLPAFGLVMTGTVAAQVNMSAAIGINSPVGQLPEGLKVLARVPLQGLPITRMYTQWEYDRTYLYIEHSGQSRSTVDLTKKRNPRLVDHEPGKVEPIRYVELFDGGTVEASSLRHVNAGIDNQGTGSMFSTLQNSDPDDATLLQAFGQGTSNLVDRDSRVVYFASPSQLLVVKDNRWRRIDLPN